MQLNLTTDYAIRCLLTINEKGGGVSSKTISEEIAVEREFTQKILRSLRDAGLVTSTRGKEGGYSLARPLSEISMLDVLIVTEDTMCINRCLEPDHYCSRHGIANGCPAHGFYTSFQRTLDKVLTEVSLQDVIDGNYKAAR